MQPARSARIRLGRPVDCEREPICSGEEALVSRVRRPGSRYDCMVERQQTVTPGSASDSPGFILRMHSEHRSRDWYLSDIELEYHFLKFLSLRFAKIMFPKNFVDAGELRVSRFGDGFQYATYSHFIRDETGAIGRRNASLGRYHGEPDVDLRMGIVAEADARERWFNQDIAGLVQLMDEAGIRIGHPEANYQVDSGRTVFFEVHSLDLASALKAAHSAGSIEGVETLSAIFSVGLRRWAEIRARKPEMKEKFELRNFTEAPFAELHTLVNSIFMENGARAWAFFAIGESYNAVKTPMWVWDAHGVKGIAPTAVELDGRIFALRTSP